jgi:hypothetical protein
MNLPVGERIDEILEYFSCTLEAGSLQRIILVPGF